MAMAGRVFTLFCRVKTPRTEFSVAKTTPEATLVFSNPVHPVHPVHFFQFGEGKGKTGFTGFTGWRKEQTGAPLWPFPNPVHPVHPVKFLSVLSDGVGRQDGQDLQDENRNRLGSTPAFSESC